MSTPQANLAARLLRYAPSTEVTDALLPQASVAEAQTAVAAPPSMPVALAAAKGGVEAATSVAASPITDPKLLERLGKMASVRVRRLVAANPHTPAAPLEAIAVRALRDNDTTTLVALCRTMSPPEWLVRLPHNTFRGQHSTARFFPGAAGVVAQLEERADAELTRRTFTVAAAAYDRMEAVANAVAVSAAQGRLPVTAAELIAGLSDGMRLRALQAIVAEHPNDLLLTDDLVDMLADLLARFEVSDYQFTSAIVRAKTLTDHGVAALLESGNRTGAVAVAAAVQSGTATLTSEQLDDLVHRGDGPLAAALLARPLLRDRLSRDQLEIVTDALERNDTVVRQVLSEVDPERLTPLACANLLRAGSYTLTEAWLTGRYQVPPTYQALELLALKPRHAIEASSNVRTPRDLDESPERLLDAFRESFSMSHLGNAHVRDLLNMAGSVTLRRAGFAEPATDPEKEDVFVAYLAERVTERFGANPDAWGMIPKLAPEVRVGTLDGFLDVIAVVIAPSETNCPSAHLTV